MPARGHGDWLWRSVGGASARGDQQAPSNIHTHFPHRTQSFTRVDALSSSLVSQIFAWKFYQRPVPTLLTSQFSAVSLVPESLVIHVWSMEYVRSEEEFKLSQKHNSRSRDRFWLRSTCILITYSYSWLFSCCSGSQSNPKRHHARPKTGTLRMSTNLSTSRPCTRNSLKIVGATHDSQPG